MNHALCVCMCVCVVHFDFFLPKQLELSKYLTQSQTFKISMYDLKLAESSHKTINVAILYMKT